MLKNLALENFTVFGKGELNFSAGLNVIIGENGAGKTHLIKIAYSLIAACIKNGGTLNGDSPTKTHLQIKIAEKLLNDFRPETIGRLVRRRQGEKCSIKARYDDPSLDISITFSAADKTEVQVDKVPGNFHEKPPVYFPTRELLSIYPNFVSIYDNHYLEFEETWRDTCKLLGALALKGPREKAAGKLLKPLEDAIGGKIFLDNNGRFYLRLPGSGEMEIPLAAEGLRKVAMVARLITTGSLLDNGYLFWDEPESNLNPRLIKLIAKTILHLCTNGIQVFIATHSLFLLREIDILKKCGFPAVPTFFVSLVPGDDGVSISQGESIDDLDPIVSLDEELEQSDRYMDSEENADERET